MIGRLLIKPFGTIWKLKERCRTASGLSGKIYRFLYHYYQFEHGSAIAYNAEFATAPIVPHGIKQIVITGDVKIGKNCIIFQQVAIQGEYQVTSQLYGSPVIGDDCYIYPGAKIIGKVKIGNKVVIGPNAVVMCDVPDYCMVSAGEPKITPL